MHRMRCFTGVASLLLFAVVGLWAPVAALADDDDKKLRADPFAFIGTAAQCAPSPAGSRIVTSAWLGGMGQPDNGGLNGVPATRNDPHKGLLLSKNGPTPDCSAAGAEIKGVRGMVVDAAFAVGYDYRNGGHCGAGAPRFNVETDTDFCFVGCANAPQSPAPQDPAQWRRTRSVLTTCGAECFCVFSGGTTIPAGAEIKSISIIFDEGTDTANNDTEGVGLAVLDNIFINGKFIRRGNGIADGPNRNGDDDDDDDDHDD